MKYHIPDTTEFQRCHHCNQLQNNWLWREIETYPEPVYEILCKHCIAQQDATFLVENAIMQALAIVNLAYAELSGRIVRAKDGAR